jgi:hypothetical protein
MVGSYPFDKYDQSFIESPLGDKHSGKLWESKAGWWILRSTLLSTQYIVNGEHSKVKA